MISLKLFIIFGPKKFKGMKDEKKKGKRCGSSEKVCCCGDFGTKLKIQSGKSFSHTPTAALAWINISE
jgi:hypothetical protein